VESSIRNKNLPPGDINSLIKLNYTFCCRMSFRHIDTFF
jgi:hypothetical protein